MPQPLGSTGNPNGRPKGAINKLAAEFRERVQQVSAEAGFDIVEEIIGIAADRNHPERMEAMKLVMSYAYPRLKAVEQTVAEPVKVVIIDPSAEGDPLG